MFFVYVCSMLPRIDDVAAGLENFQEQVFEDPGQEQGKWNLDAR